jgi:hypothetical protein
MSFTQAWRPESLSEVCWMFDGRNEGLRLGTRASLYCSNCQLKSHLRAFMQPRELSSGVWPPRTVPAVEKDQKQTRGCADFHVMMWPRAFRRVDPTDNAQTSTPTLLHFIAFTSSAQSLVSKLIYSSLITARSLRQGRFITSRYPRHHGYAGEKTFSETNGCLIFA